MGSQPRPLIVRAVRKVARLARNFLLDPRKFTKSVVRRRLMPVVTGRRSRSVASRPVTAPARERRRLPNTSIVALLGDADSNDVLATPFADNTDLVLLVDGRDRTRVAGWLSNLNARCYRMYVFERSRPACEMLRYGLNRAQHGRIVVLPRTGQVSYASVAAALDVLPEDDAAFHDTGDVLALRKHVASELASGAVVRDDLAAAFARVCGPHERTPEGDRTRAPEGDRTGVFVLTWRRREQLIDRLLVRDETLDRQVVYGLDPERLLELLEQRGCETPPGLALVNTRKMPGHFVYVAPPPGALFVEPAEHSGIVCLERRPTWYQEVREQVRAATDVVTVIMTVYNDAATLDVAIDSILDQSYRNIELIIVDDGSTDGSLDVARRKMSHDHRIRLLRTPTNSGTYVAKNLGLVYATGDFVTFQDADDVSLGHRIELQVADLYSDPTATANLMRYQRLSDATGLVLWIGGRKDRPCFPTLMLRTQQMLDTVGFFDSVRVGGDSELVARLTAATGRKPRTLPVIGYLARHVQGSLTTSGAGEIKLSPDGVADLPPARVAHWDAARQWHREIADGAASPYVPFPLRERPFAAPARIMPGSWADPGEAVTASIATIPERTELLPQVVGSLLPQVDRLQVYLNNFDEIPAVLDHPKITVVRSQDFGDLKDNGKFFGVEQIPDGYHFTVDDDIVYPPDYVQKSILKIEQYERRVAVGVHGVNLADPLVRYMKGRQVEHFKSELSHDQLVQLLGTGTLAYHTSTLRPSFDEFRTTGVADLWLAIQARRHGVGLLAQARPTGWLQPIDHDGDTIFYRAQREDERETAIAVEHGPWNTEAMGDIWRPLARDIIKRQPAPALSTMGYNVHQLAALAGREPIHFTLIVPGWNCADHVQACWESIERQRPGHYTREVYFIDDASTDDTWDALTRLRVNDDIHLVRHEENRGPAYARYAVLRQITDPNRVCVLLDLDDELTRETLWRLAEVYLSDQRVWMTCGSWRDRDRRYDTSGFYDQSTVRHRAYRDASLFRCSHPRSFRRFLFDPLGPEHFQHPLDGGWLKQCSDVALLLPMLEQCAPDNIVHLHDVLYRYHRHRDAGTLERFGKGQKVATFRALCAQPRLPGRSIDPAPVST